MSATGVVQLLGTPVTSGMAAGTVASVFQNPPVLNQANVGTAGGTTSYMGLDLGSGNAASVVEWRICVCPSSAAGLKEPLTADGTQMCGGAGSNPTSSSTTIDLLPGRCVLTPGFKFTRRRVYRDDTSLGTWSFRSFGIFNPNNFCLVSACQFLADATTITGTPTFMPVAPEIFPHGGHSSQANPYLITITSLTTSAAIYYTTDGTTPSNVNGTLYTGTFSIEFSGVTTLKAVAYDTNCSTTLSNVSSAIFNNYSFKPGDVIYDQYGDPIRTQACGFLYANGRWWRYGGTYLTSNEGTSGADQEWYDGIHLESSLDLQNWIHHGRILDNGPNTSTSAVSSAQRPHVRYCAATGLYVMYVHLYPANLAGVATAPTPMGPWNWVKRYNPDGAVDVTILGYKDQYFFVDPDTGTGYLFYTTATTGGANGRCVVTTLTADFMNTNGAQPISVTFAAALEGPVMGKRNGQFIFIAGAPNFYDTQLVDVAPQYTMGPTIAAAAAAGGANVFATSQLGTFFNGQQTDLLNINGKFLLWQDYWPNSGAGNRILDLYNSCDSVVQLSFTGNSALQALTPPTFNLSAPFTDGGSSGGNGVFGGGFGNGVF